MLCVAYGSEQSPALQVHRPEVCYAAGGFRIEDVHGAQIELAARRLPVTRLWASMPGRSEPITYWIVLGDRVVADSGAFRWRQVMSGLRGEIGDGMLVRVSSIGRDAQAGYRTHARFASALSAVIPGAYHDRVLGAGTPG